MATGPTGWASCESSLVPSQPASTFSQKMIKWQRALVFRSSLPRSHPSHNWILQVRPSHKRMQGLVLWQLYTAAAKIIILQSARVLLSRVSDSWSPLFSYKGPIEPPCYNNTLFYSDVMAYNWHSEHQRKGMGTTEQWMDPRFMNNLMMIMLRVQVLFPSSCI